MHDIFLSVVIVVDRWIDDAAAVVQDMSSTLSGRFRDYEIVLVDNGTDSASSVPIYRSITASDGAPNVQVFRLLNRVSYETAAWAGVENSLGDYVLVIEPFSEDLTPLDDAIEAVMAGPLDLVLIVNDAPRDHGLIDRIMRSSYRALFRSAAKIDLQVEASQYRLLSKRVVSYLLQQPNPSSVYRTLPAAVGFPRKVIHYAAKRRPYPGRTMLDDMHRGVDILLSSSIAPLRLASIMSLVGALLNILYSAYVIVLAFTRSNIQPGWTTLSLQQSGMFFLWSLLAFIVTEYLVVIIEGQRFSTPYYVLDEMNSAVLTRRERLNVETASEAPEASARHG